ncbi:hypothetical protein [Aquimarina pacifica]|uniref:hypothetical protein n=1 Tax=Aquimarina pacifica TaxID=1296415 RepID=UPI0004B76003|nr:hypothetical protein [Aquimarina pacifica]
MAFKIGVLFFLLGLVLLAILLILHISNSTISQVKIPILSTQISKVFFGLLPILFTFFSFWFIQRDYNQTLIIPEAYEGVIIVEYGQKDGQSKKWNWGFLGIGASREITIGTKGYAKTQFSMNTTEHFPLLGSSNRATNTGMTILSENGKEFPIDNLQTTSFDDLKKISENINTNTPILYLSEYSMPPLVVGILTKPSEYSKYFLSDKEITDIHGSAYTDMNMLKPMYKKNIWKTYNLK